MKKLFNVFFVSLGVIFLLLLIAGGLFVYFDPYELKPLYQSLRDITISSKASDINETNVNNESDPDINNVEDIATETRFTPAQEKLLDVVGIDADAVPTEFTAEQEACFINLFGKTRVQQIVSGDSPTLQELSVGAECL